MEKEECLELIYGYSKKLAKLLQSAGGGLVVAESHTGGLISSHLTDIPGSHRWYESGCIVFNSESKQKLLGVPKELIDRQPDVSAEVAAEMAVRARDLSGAMLAISATGLTGPGRDSVGRAPGLVYIGIACADGYVVSEYHFDGSREAIRFLTNLAAVKLAVWVLAAYLGGSHIADLSAKP